LQSEGVLIDVLRAAGRRELPEGWLFLRPGEILARSACLLASNMQVGEVRAAAAQLGFSVYGLDTRLLEIIVVGESGASHAELPGDNDLVQVYAAQLEFDALASARFYQLLGDERPGTQCQSRGCERGAISLSVFCQLHHFETIQHRPCFDDW
jgi:hypothetical protein